MIIAKSVKQLYWLRKLHIDSSRYNTTSVDSSTFDTSTSSFSLSPLIAVFCGTLETLLPIRCHNFLRKLPQDQAKRDPLNETKMAWKSWLTVPNWWCHNMGIALSKVDIKDKSDKSDKTQNYDLRIRRIDEWRKEVIEKYRKKNQQD